jgi:hypothetical protein
LYLAGALGLLTACAGADSPEGVADRFWAAVQAGDAETAQEYSIESEDTTLKLEEGESAIDSYEVGASRVEDARAFVETRVRSAGDWELDIDFETVLVQHEGDWKVDVDRTGSQMVRAAIGASTDELVRGIADTLRGAMGEVMEGVAEGVKELGDALGETAEKMKKEDDH